MKSPQEDMKSLGKVAMSAEMKAITKAIRMKLRR